MFVLCLVASNIAEIKVVKFLGIAIGGGTLLFPLSYVIIDISVEVYGFTLSRNLILLGFISNVLFTSFLYFITLLPEYKSSDLQHAFTSIFSFAPMLSFASIMSYLLGELLNLFIVTILKKKFGRNKFAIRAILSTALSSLLESTLFCFISFFQRISTQEIINMIFMLVLVKVCYEIALLPFIIKIVSFLRKSVVYY